HPRHLRARHRLALLGLEQLEDRVLIAQLETVGGELRLRGVLMPRAPAVEPAGDGRRQREPEHPPRRPHAVTIYSTPGQLPPALTRLDTPPIRLTSWLSVRRVSTPSSPRSPTRPAGRSWSRWPAARRASARWPSRST